MRNLVWLVVIIVLIGAIYLVTHPEAHVPTMDKVAVARTVVSQFTARPTAVPTEWVRATVTKVEPNVDGVTLTVWFNHPDGFNERATASTQLGITNTTSACFELPSATRREDPTVRVILTIDTNLLRCAN